MGSETSRSSKMGRRPSSRRTPSTRRLLLFFVWLLSALLGETLLVVQLLGPAFVSGWVGLVITPSPWWPATGVLLLGVGLAGLIWEQRDARRGEPRAERRSALGMGAASRFLEAS